MLRRLVGSQMQARDRFAQSMHQLRRQRPRLRHAIEQIGLGEPAHDHHVIERRPLAIECQSTARATIDRADTEVKLRRGPPVQHEFRLARRLAQFARRVVERGIADRALELVGAVRRQKDNRTMCVDPLDFA